MKTASEISAGLQHFYGSETFTRYMGGLQLTEGVSWLAENAGSFWLIDIIASVQHMFTNEQREFLVHKLVRNDAGSAVFTTEDGNDKVLYTQNISFTDFPLPEITLWQGGKTILLPSEY